RCCWTRLDDSPWPGTPATVAGVLEVYANMTRGDTDLARRWATGELRRLSDTGWLVLDEAGGAVRLGPRVALWPEGSLASLRDLVRRLPEPPRSEPEPEPEPRPESGPAGSSGSSAPPVVAHLPSDPASVATPSAEKSEPVDNSEIGA
ncbi:MAG: hypothetical protein ACRDNL_00765, partial [Spirillospora sp.]